MTMTLRERVSTVPTPDDTVLLDERTGTYWQINATGTLILHALLDSETPERAAEQLTGRFPDLPPERAERDVAELLAALAGLVTS